MLHESHRLTRLRRWSWSWSRSRSRSSSFSSSSSSSSSSSPLAPGESYQRTIQHQYSSHFKAANPEIKNLGKESHRSKRHELENRYQYNDTRTKHHIPGSYSSSDAAQIFWLLAFFFAL
ncbi:MAG: hypothetical protein FE78DRAFT_467401 [Acidomyces sp. 'richmondensis']|nr:MAG: hypothetical protein FE78DRAFT_467401 [Acidomyces sp. 'richmondensis']